MVRTLVVLTAILALLGGAAQANIISKYGIQIQSCVVNENNGQTNGINVVYTNGNEVSATEVDFLLNYRGKHYTLTDTGTFTQGAQINHNLKDNLVGFGWDGSTPNRCTVRKVVLSNGKVLSGAAL
jgi:hypothetical protein